MEPKTIDREFVARVIPPRLLKSHKRMNGTVCVLGGNWLYHGAPYLCSMGALRSGVDLVYTAVPAKVAPSIRSLSPDLIVVPLPDGKLTRGSVSKLLSWTKGVDCFAVGPGLGPQRAGAIATALLQLKSASTSMVLDADALRAEVLGVLGRGTLVTPHAGEFSRLFGVELPDELSGRVKTAEKCAKQSGLTVLLKGPADVITDGDRTALNETHSPAMTVGGTGDVLTGLCAGLLAKGVPSFEAACASAFINGSAGAEAARELGLHIAASDVLSRIPAAMKGFDRTN
ncbi:MAG: NAD(P)H-hydrate dehydratase [archaeon]|nr:MAG: NAD(P)H-hydrate dehydratase [archaeon]